MKLQRKKALLKDCPCLHNNLEEKSELGNSVDLVALVNIKGNFLGKWQFCALTYQPQQKHRHLGNTEVTDMVPLWFPSILPGKTTPSLQYVLD